VLVECEGEGENALDLSGDVGAVGRFSVLKKPGGEGENMFLDLKGVMYHATIVPSTTFMVVNLGPTEAKVGTDLLLSTVVLLGRVFPSLFLPRV
jgi:hypothetical protein